MDERTLELRDGTKIEIQVMDLRRFIRFKDIMAELVERTLAEPSPHGKANDLSGNVLLMRALKKVTEADVLDLLTTMTGFEDRELLSRQFRPRVLFEALQITLRDEGIDLGGLLGEAPRSPGPQPRTDAVMPSISQAS